jgi:hypothetical protein
MPIMGAARPLLVITLLVALVGCAERGSGTASPEPTRTASLPADSDALVLQVEHVGGFVTPEMLAGRLPLVSVYADGRVITEGPVPAIYPGPALPNVLVTRIDPARVQELADRALEAGIDSSADLGTPPVADLPSTRFTLVTESGPIVREVYALLDPESGLDPDPSAGGVTEEQAAARAELWELQSELADIGLGDAGDQEPYRPEVVAAVVRPWTDPEELEPELQQPEMAWPGPDLPGETLNAMLEVSCLTATGAEAEAVLGAAADATAITPWVGVDGMRWSVTFRPLLPHESDCADLLQQ